MIMGGGASFGGVTHGNGGYEQLQDRSGETPRRRTEKLLNPEKSKLRRKLWLMTSGGATATAFQVGAMFSNPLVLAAAGAAAAAGVLGYFASRKG
jgi:hypothetical protein